MKHKFKILALLCCFSLTFTNCKKSELTEESGLLKASKNLAEAADGKWDLLGYGYDMTGDLMAPGNASDAPIINVEKFKSDYSNYVATPGTTGNRTYFYAGATAIEFLKEVNREREFGGSISGPPQTAEKDAKPLFTGSLTVKNTSQNIYSFNSKKSYARNETAVRIKQIRFTGDATIALLRQYLTPEFLNNVNTYSADALVERYGTHVLTNIVLGGRYVFDFNAEIVNETTTEKKTSSVKAAMGFVIKKIGFNFNAAISGDEMTKSFNESRTREFVLTFYGGTNSGRSISFDSNGYTQENVNITSWEQSVNVNNCALVDIENAVPIYEFIADPVKQQQVKAAVNAYIASKQIKLEYATTNLYRGYNPRNGDRLLTVNPTELTSNGFVNEGIIGKIYSDNSKIGTVPLYRGYLKSGRHLFGLDWNEAHLGSYEGVVGYVNSSSETNHLPIYRYRNNKAPHFYTTNLNEVAGNRSWILEGNIGYILQ